MSEVNFKNFYKIYLCPLGCNSEDSQEHLLYCKEIYGHEVNENQNYENIFSNNITKLNKIDEKMTEALKKREEIIKQKEVTNNLWKYEKAYFCLSIIWRGPGAHFYSCAADVQVLNIYVRGHAKI